MANRGEHKKASTPTRPKMAVTSAARRSSLQAEQRVRHDGQNPTIQRSPNLRPPHERPKPTTFVGVTRAIDQRSPSTRNSPTPRSSTPNASTPKTSTPRTSTPNASTPKTSTPRTSTPNASTPKTSTPRTSTPNASTPGQSPPKRETTSKARKKSRFYKVFQRKIRRYGMLHALPEWAQKGLLDKIYQDRGRRKVLKKRQNQMLEKQFKDRIPGSVQVLTGVQGSGDEIYPIVRKDKATRKTTTPQRSKTNKERDEFSPPLTSSFPVESIIYAPDERVIQEVALYEKEQRPAKEEVKKKESSTDETSGSSESFSAETSDLSDQSDGEPKGLSPLPILAKPQTPEEEGSKRAVPQVTSSKHNWRSFAGQPVQAAIQPVMVSSSEVKNESLLKLLKVDKTESSSSMNQSNSKPTTWNPFASIEELRKHDTLFTDEVTKQNTICSTALVCVAPTDPKRPTKSKSKRARDVKFLSSSRNIKFEYHRKKPTPTPDRSPAPNTPARTVFELMRRQIPPTEDKTGRKK